MVWQRRAEEFRKTRAAQQALGAFLGVCAIVLALLVAAAIARAQPEPPSLLGIVRDTGDPCTGVIVVPPDVVAETEDEINTCVHANIADNLGCLMAGMRLRIAIARDALGCPGAAAKVQVERELIRMLTLGEVGS